MASSPSDTTPSVQGVGSSITIRVVTQAPPPSRGTTGFTAPTGGARVLASSLRSGERCRCDSHTLCWCDHRSAHSDRPLLAESTIISDRRDCLRRAADHGRHPPVSRCATTASRHSAPTPIALLVAAGEHTRPACLSVTGPAAEQRPSRDSPKQHPDPDTRRTGQIPRAIEYPTSAHDSWAHRPDAGGGRVTSAHGKQARMGRMVR